jgi:hypothetical protein
MGGTKGGGSTNFFGSGQGGGSSTNFFGSGQGGYGQRGQSMSNPLSMIDTIMAQLSPEYAKRFGGQQSQFGNMDFRREPAAMTMPVMPEYVNYQQMPTYNTQSVGPSQSILDFMNYGYASGGSVEERGPDDEIETALRIVRLLGELKKKL